MPGARRTGTILGAWSRVKNPVRIGRKDDLQAKRKVLTPHTGDTENVALDIVDKASRIAAVRKRAAFKIKTKAGVS